MARRLILLLAALVTLPAPAAAVTVRDIVALSGAGLPDDILIAVIDADRTIFTLDAEQILELKRAGVRDAVLLKMLRSRREFERPPDAPQEVAPLEVAPHVVVIGGRATRDEVSAHERPRYWEQAPYPFLYTPFPIWGAAPPRGPRPAPAPFLSPEYRGFGRFINDGWVGRP